jgi:hypothetical protein
MKALLLAACAALLVAACATPCTAVGDGAAGCSLEVQGRAGSGAGSARLTR